MIRVWILILSLLSSVVYADAGVIYPLATPRQQAQFEHLLKELRCLVCQNQDLADSHAPLAQDLRNKVYQMVQDNQSDTEINRYLTERYGDFILFKPPVKVLTWFLWFGPLLFLIIGVFIWHFGLRRSYHA